MTPDLQGLLDEMLRLSAQLDQAQKELEEAVKAVIVFRRFQSRKWIHNLVNAPAD